MSNITIFEDITTSEILDQLEADSKAYTGLYVDMKNAKERKFVKDKAVLINGMLKKLDRARIDKSKDYKILVESEAKEIKARLEVANEPFTLLIDEYNKERAKILAEEKRVNEEKLAAIQYDRDFDDAEQLDRLFDLEAKEAAANLVLEQQAQEKHEREIAENAAAQAREEAAKLIIKQQEESLAREAKAKQDAIDAEARAKQAAVDAENKAKQDVLDAELRLILQKEKAENDKQLAVKAEQDRQIAKEKAEADALTRRKANKAHNKKINNEVMQCFIDGGMTDDCAKLAVTLLAKKAIKHAVINY